MPKRNFASFSTNRHLFVEYSLARGEKRALLSLATGAGKTFIAVQLLKKIADAGQLKRALFVCDRDELRSQALSAFHIDECHRSAWDKWSQVLTRNPNAVQIGLTATPRTLKITEKSKEAEADWQITADNLKYFGEPVYEYDIAQGIEDGYLAACEIHRIDLFLDDRPETEGIEREDLTGKTLTDATTGQQLSVPEARARYGASDLEDKLLLPERVAAFKCTASAGGAQYLADLRGTRQTAEPARLSGREYSPAQPITAFLPEKVVGKSGRCS